MAYCTRILINLMIVSAFHCLVAPEVDHIILVLDELKAEGLVPSDGEHIEGDLPAY